MTGLLFLIEVLACLAITVRAIDYVRKMSTCTRIHVFAAWVVLGSAAAQIAINIISGRDDPELYSMLLVLAVALIVWTERRRTG